jgi:hypothetical protein
VSVAAPQFTLVLGAHDMGSLVIDDRPAFGHRSQLEPARDRRKASRAPETLPCAPERMLAT